ncbi:3-hydroxyacyl-ACP dehydratase FabZ [Hellea sp.]|nr:3-hydroxyacyl-ACP dehydratase FabZ [Hellea sp.]
MPHKHTLPLDRDYVKHYLPHRDPMLFIDRVTGLDENAITIESDVDPEAAYFKGHFPGMPIMPGVLIVETVAQAGALLVSLTRGLSDDKFIAFSNVDAVKFRRPVTPGEMLTINVEIERIRLPFYKFTGTATVEGKVAATLKFAAAEMSYDT